MKTEGQSSSGSEGARSRNDGDFVDVGSESECDSSDDRQYQEYDVNTFLDNVLTGVGTDDGKMKRLGKALKQACADGNLVQLVRGVLHLVELYQAGKGSRSRSQKAAVGNRAKRKTAPSKKPKKGARRRRRHEDEGAIPQGRNKVVDVINLEENAANSEADRSNSTQGRDENGDLQDLEPSPSIILKREEELPPVDEEDGNTFERRERSPPSRPPRPEDSENSSRIDSSTYRDGARAFKRRKRFRKTSQKKKKISKFEHISSAGRESSSSSTESDVSRHSSSSSSSSRYSSSSSRSETDVSRHGGNNSSRRQRDVSRHRGNHSSRYESDVSRHGGNHSSRSRSDVSRHRENPSSKSSVSRREESSTKTEKWKFEGPVCKRMFPYKSHLEIHSKTYTGERPFPCPRPNCGKTFQAKGTLKTHLLAHDGAFKCPYPGCTKVFGAKANLEAHKREHTGVMPFKCKFPGCFKEFALKSRLSLHEGVHTRPFSCPFQGCRMAFTVKATLQTHQRKHNHY